MPNSNDLRFCPLCDKSVDDDLCYEICMCMCGGLKISSIPEVNIKKDDINKSICKKCQFNDLM